MTTILGGRGGGLWAPLAGRLADSYRQGRECVLLVPEQYTLQAERDALAALNVPGFFRLRVLSPSRFARAVFERAGRDPRVVIDERGKLMTMARAVWSARADLSFYASAREKPGFAHKLTQAVSELKGAGLGPEGLEAHLSSLDKPEPKLSDLARLYREYESLLAGHLIDQEDEDRELLARFTGSGLFDGADFFVYGFDLLSEPLVRLLAACAKKARRMLVALVMDRESAPDGEAFAPVRRSAARLTQALGEAGLPWSYAWAPEEKAAQGDALSHLRGQFLRLKQEPYPGKASEIRIFAGKTPHEELRWAAQQIRRELRAGIQPREMAVLLAQDGYAGQLPSVFADYGVPHYLAEKEPVLAHPLVRCLTDALDCIQAAAWKQEDVLSYAKNPFSPLTAEEGWALENWALRFGIRGSRWTRPFSGGGDEERAAAEALRQKAVSPIIALRDALVQAKDASDSVRAVLAFLESLDAHGRVTRLEQEMLECGLPEQALRTRQVWDQLIGLLEQMDELLGRERIPLGRFPEWLREGLGMTELSALPPQDNCVQAGALGQVMARRPKAVFILGLNGGALNVSDEALLGDGERQRLESGLNLRLNLPLADREAVKQLDLWKAMSSAGERLYLSYALSTEQGEAKGALPELQRVAKLFPALAEEGGAVGRFAEPLPLTPATALDEIASLRAAGEPLQGAWRDAWAWLSESPEFGRAAAALLDREKAENPDKRLSPGTAQALFNRQTVSISRLENYAGCPFRHFVRYGLQPQERREWALQPVDLGNFCHAAMDGFAEEIAREPDWPQVSRDKAEAMMDRVLPGLTGDWERQPWADTPRARKGAQRTLDVCRRMAWALTEGSRDSGFRPLASELRFGAGEGLPAVEIALGDGRSLRLRGTMDRVDTAVLDGRDYLRVVDYKTGNRRLAAGDIEAGLQLQLMLYLKAALGLLAGHEPAGAFYQLLDDPVVPADSAPEAERKIRAKLRLSGVLLAQAQVVRLMDGGEPPVSIANYLNKDGSLRASDGLLSREELERLMGLAQARARQLARQIFSGHIPRSPIIDSAGRPACDFCEYQGVCRTDGVSREAMLRRARKMGLQALAAPGGGEGGG